VKKNSDVYITPYGDCVAIRGFLLRSVEGKDYREITDGKPYFYGFHHLTKFKYGQTLFIVEGAKEAEAIYKISGQPALATMASTISKAQLQIAKYLTLRLIWVGDNDKWGRKNLRLNKARCGQAVLPVGFKDLGELFEGNEIMVGSYIKGVVKAYI